MVLYGFRVLKWNWLWHPAYGVIWLSSFEMKLTVTPCLWCYMAFEFWNETDCDTLHMVLYGFRVLKWNWLWHPAYGVIWLSSFEMKLTVTPCLWCYMAFEFWNETDCDTLHMVLYGFRVLKWNWLWHPAYGVIWLSSFEMKLTVTSWGWWYKTETCRGVDILTMFFILICILLVNKWYSISNLHGADNLQLFS